MCRKLSSKFLGLFIHYRDKLDNTYVVEGRGLPSSSSLCTLSFYKVVLSPANKQIINTSFMNINNYKYMLFGVRPCIISGDFEVFFMWTCPL